MNDTPTPRTDEWETYCDECYYHMWRVRRKNERGFNDGFHLNNGEGARQLVELLNKQDSELTAARELVKNLEITVLSLMMENKTVTEQRDRLAEECAKIRDVAERAIDYLDQSYRDGFSTEVSELRYELAAVKGWSDES